MLLTLSLVAAFSPLAAFVAPLVLPVLSAALVGALPVCGFLLGALLVSEVAADRASDADAFGSALAVSTSAGMAQRAAGRAEWTAEVEARTERTIARFADRAVPGFALACLEDVDGSGALAMDAGTTDALRSSLASWRSARLAAAGADVVIRAGRPVSVVGRYGRVSGRGRFGTVRHYAPVGGWFDAVDTDEAVAVASGHLCGVDLVARDLAAADAHDRDEAAGW